MLPAVPQSPLSLQNLLRTTETPPLAVAAPHSEWPPVNTSDFQRIPPAVPVPAAIAEESLFDQILKKALAVSFASCSAETIDRTDIRKASLEAMRRSACNLAVAPAFAITDGLDVPAGLPCPGEAFVKGDQRSYSIAAASIVAKVMRDRMMGNCAARHVGYGFEFHMGYATERHRAAIEVEGACARLHRLSFAPFRLEAVIEQQVLMVEQA